MAQAKRPPLPVILLANDLLDGDIVFWTGTAWSRHLIEAFIARDEQDGLSLETVMTQELVANHVVDACLVDVAINADGIAVPRHVRERIKTSGPTIRLDLGKQAGLSFQARELS
jgi:hypothetical protein